jgi:uncharacterized protein
LTTMTRGNRDQSGTANRLRQTLSSPGSVAVVNRTLPPLALFLFLFGLHAATAEETVPALHKLDRPEILRVIFYPRQTERNPAPPGARDIDFSVDQDIRIGCRLYAAEKDAPVIFYFHGNGEIVADHDDLGPFYTDQSLNFLVCDYRGYGWSGGSPSVGAIIGDGRVLYEKTRKWLAENGYTGSFLVMGRSLGSANAIDLAAEYSDEIDGLIIESGFAETLPLAANLGIDLSAMGLTEEDGFNNIGKIEKVTKPILILHGQTDSLIPLGQAQKLHSAAGAKYKELQIVPGADHNSMVATGGKLYFQTIRRFAAKAAGTDERRPRKNR